MPAKDAAGAEDGGARDAKNHGAAKSVSELRSLRQPGFPKTIPEERQAILLSDRFHPNLHPAGLLKARS